MYKPHDNEYPSKIAKGIADKRRAELTESGFHLSASQIDYLVDIYLQWFFGKISFTVYRELYDEAIHAIITGIGISSN